MKPTNRFIFQEMRLTCPVKGNVNFFAHQMPFQTNTLELIAERDKWSEWGARPGAPPGLATGGHNPRTPTPTRCYFRFPQAKVGRHDPSPESLGPVKSLVRPEPPARRANHTRENVSSLSL